MGVAEKGTINPYKYYEMRRIYTIKEIAKMTGYTVNGLLRWCYRNGVETNRISDSDIAEEIKTKTAKEIASEYNVTLKIVYYRLEKMGISPKLQRGIK